MEQNNSQKPVKKVQKKWDYSTVHLNRDFMKKVLRLVERANKKSFGKKVNSKMILENLFYLADEKLLEKVVKKTQEDSLSHNDKREAFFKERLSQFKGSKEQMELKMMEIFDRYLSENQT